MLSFEHCLCSFIWSHVIALSSCKRTRQTNKVVLGSLRQALVKLCGWMVGLWETLAWVSPTLRLSDYAAVLVILSHSTLSTSHCSRLAHVTYLLTLDSQVVQYRTGAPNPNRPPARKIAGATKFSEKVCVNREISFCSIVYVLPVYYGSFTY